MPIDFQVNEGRFSTLDAEHEFLARCCSDIINCGHGEFEREIDNKHGDSYQLGAGNNHWLHHMGGHRYRLIGRRQDEAMLLVYRVLEWRLRPDLSLIEDAP